jgi:hypothetical protein
VQVEEAAQAYAGFAGLPCCPLCGCDGVVRGEQVLDGEGGVVVGGCDVHHGQAGAGDVCVIDRLHACRDAAPVLQGSAGQACSLVRLSSLSSGAAVSLPPELFGPHLCYLVSHNRLVVPGVPPGRSSQLGSE